MMHSFTTISRYVGAVECTGPSPKLQGWTALTKQGYSFCEAEDKPPDVEERGLQGGKRLMEGKPA